MGSLIDTLTDKESTWHGASLLSVAQITPSALLRLFRVTEDSMKELAVGYNNFTTVETTIVVLL